MSSIIDPENTIAFMGIEGANADLACRQACPYMHTMPCPSFEDVFEAVESGKAALGMIPIENTQAGRVAEIHQILPKSNLHIVGEFFQRIEHHLLAPKNATLESITHVYSHPQGLMQCRENIRGLGYVTHAYSNTAQAAANVAEWNDKTKAAIASPLAGQLYGLKTIKEHMQDHDDNVTIFIIIARNPVMPKESDGQVLTSILFTIRNIPSALYKVLGGFATNSINIVKLESYIPGGLNRGSAQFFITFEGHPDQRTVKNAMEELGFFCSEVRMLGVYPADSARYA